MITAVSTRPKKQYRSICSRIPRSIALAPHPPCEPAHIGCTLVSNRLATRRNKAVARNNNCAVKRGDCFRAKYARRHLTRVPDSGRSLGCDVVTASHIIERTDDVTNCTKSIVQYCRIPAFPAASDAKPRRARELGGAVALGRGREARTFSSPAEPSSQVGALCRLDPRLWNPRK